MGNLCCCSQVNQSTVAITEHFGKFDDVLTPGCHCVPWVFGYRIAGRLSLRVQQLDVKCDAKTKDNVFVNVVASVQYRALQKDAHHAFYRLSNTKSLIEAYVLDVVRSTVPKFDLDAAFERKIEIGNAVDDELAQALIPYGYGMVQTLIVDIKPDKHVKRAMNETHAATRPRMKAIEKGGAEMLMPNEITHLRRGEWYGTDLGEADSVCAKEFLDHKFLSQPNLKIDNRVLIQVEPSVLSPPPIVGNTTVTIDSVLESKINELMLEMRNNNVFLRKLYEVAEENKFWKDLVLGLHTSASTQSGPFPTTPGHGSMNNPAHLQDLRDVAGQKIAKEYGLEDLFAKSTAVLKKGTSKAPGAASKAPDGEDKGDTEDFMDNTT